MNKESENEWLKIYTSIVKSKSCNIEFIEEVLKDCDYFCSKQIDVDNVCIREFDKFFGFENEIKMTIRFCSDSPFMKVTLMDNRDKKTVVKVISLKDLSDLITINKAETNKEKYIEIIKYIENQMIDNYLKIQDSKYGNV